jgi:hypothetical protein
MVAPSPSGRTNCVELRKAEVRRTPLPCTRVNKGTKKGRSCYTPTRRSREYFLSLQTLLYLLNLLTITLSPTLDVL